MKPSDFLHDYPYDSALQNSESEQIAQNIMIILKRTGDKFRDLTWDEYKEERLKEGNFTTSERKYFDNAIPYCCSEEAAKGFSKHWYKI